MMNIWTILLAAFAVLATIESAEYKIVCYFGSWAVYRPGAGKFNISYIDPSLCTHLIYTFVGISEDGDVKVLDSWQDLPDNYGKNGFGRFNNLRKLNKDTKTMVAIGGWNEGSTKYSHVVANPSLRAKFVDNVVKFVLKYNFDGFDIDWEYPNQRGGNSADKENYVSLLKELRPKFDEHGLLLSAAVGAAESSASKSYLIPQLSKYLDFINLMTYDLHGSWETVTGINAPLYARSGETGNQAKLNVNSSIQYWLEQGAAPEKLVLGVPFYGRSFTLQNANNNGIGAPTTGPGMAGPYTREAGTLGYNEICVNLMNGGWNVVFQQQQRAPYAYKGNQWVGYDDIQSLTDKSKFIESLGLGGAMLWSIETDDFRGACGEKYPLLKTLNHVLRNGKPVDPTKPPHTTIQPTEPPTKPTDSTSTSDPSGNICVKEGFVRDPKDCAKFYHCVKEGGSLRAVEFRCPDGLVFDPKINTCNYPDLVKC